MYRLWAPSLLVCAILASSPLRAAQWKYGDVADVVAATMPSFVNIYNRRLLKETDPKPARPSENVAEVEDDVGSGVVVRADGLIITNRHVIDNAYALFVTLNDGRRLPAKLVLAGSNYDLAVIKVDVGDKPLKPAALGDSKKMRVGDRVVAIGNPLGFAGSVSAGVISAFHRQIGLSAYDDLIQTDATINRGNSGGPLFNMNGEVIGINQAIYTQNKGGSIGIGFAIPIDDVKRAHEDTEKFGRPRLGWLGVTIQPVTEPMAASLGLGPNNGGGAIIGSVKPDSPAAAAGLKIGDIVRTFGTEPLRDAVALNRAVAVSAGRKIDLGVWRNGALVKVAVAIGDFPGNAWITSMAPRPEVKSLSDLGATFKNRGGLDGVEVADVVDKSVAWYAGVRAGDIIRKVRRADVRNMDDLMREVMSVETTGAEGAAIYVDGPNGPRWLYVDMLR
ncbi:MAG: trypsin-like peptidase domain-containing protein [Beijerinckiaceae bacterium]